MNMLKVFLLILVGTVTLNNTYAGHGDNGAADASAPTIAASEAAPERAPLEFDQVEPQNQRQFDETMQDPKQPSAYKKKAFAGYILYITMTITYQFGSETAEMVLTQLNAFLAADLLTAAFHWLEDTYFTEKTPVIGTIIQENIRHHKKPRFMATIPFYETLAAPVLAATIAGAIIVVLVQSPSYAFLLPFLGWGAVTNQVHKWEHMPKKERPWIVQKLQGYLFQSCEEHKEHHTPPYTKNYCVLSPYLNRLLEGLGFWRGVENMVEFITGVPPRLRDQKPAQDDK